MSLVHKFDLLDVAVRVMGTGSICMLGLARARLLRGATRCPQLQGRKLQSGTQFAPSCSAWCGHNRAQTALLALGLMRGDPVQLPKKASKPSQPIRRGFFGGPKSASKPQGSSSAPAATAAGPEVEHPDRWKELPALRGVYGWVKDACTYCDSSGQLVDASSSKKDLIEKVDRVCQTSVAQSNLSINAHKGAAACTMPCKLYQSYRSTWSAPISFQLITRGGQVHVCQHTGRAGCGLSVQQHPTTFLAGNCRS